MSLGLLVDLGCDDPSHRSWSFQEKDTRSNRSRAQEAQWTEVRSNKGRRSGIASTRNKNLIYYLT